MVLEVPAAEVRTTLEIPGVVAASLVRHETDVRLGQILILGPNEGVSLRAS